MLDHSAGAISSADGKRLLADLATVFDDPEIKLYPGVSYRNIMVDSSGRRDYSRLQTTPPHDIPGEKIASFLPRHSPHAEMLRGMIEKSKALFADHPVNRQRVLNGLAPASHIWPWGQGTRPSMPSFHERFGLRGAMITAVDLLAGISAFIGWDRLSVPGQTSYHDNDYAAAGRYAIDALNEYDIVCVHVEAPDEASHQADAKTKVAAIEAIDRHVIGPVHAALRLLGDYRLLVLPDHYTSVATRKHDPTPPPFAMCGNMVSSVVHRPFNEDEADESDLHIEFGHELMEYFLFSGLKR
jgi:2,3-bisphosphoglycerate-independent phosphoglycerate mutase